MQEKNRNCHIFEETIGKNQRKTLMVDEYCKAAPYLIAIILLRKIIVIGALIPFELNVYGANVI